MKRVNLIILKIVRIINYFRQNSEMLYCVSPFFILQEFIIITILENR